MKRYPFSLLFIAVISVLSGIAPAGLLALPADYTADDKVDMADFAVLSSGWQDDFGVSDLERLVFHWLVDVSVEPVVVIESVYTDQSGYEPGQVCGISVECKNHSSQLFTGQVSLHITHYGTLVHSEIQDVSINSLHTVTKMFSWTTPTPDFEGYLVEAWLSSGSGQVTAIDVSSDWKRYPRYGYITEFYAGQSYTQNTEMLNTLSRKYHVNSLQYYDWMWRHENVIQRYAGSIVNPWYDWRGAAISFNVLQDSIAKANNRSMAPMPYFQIYLGLDGYQATSGVSPEWGLYSDTAHANQYYHDAGVKMWLFNPGNVAWQNHLCDEYTDALGTMDWAGIHLDQLGNIGGGNYYDYWGNWVDLPWAMGAMLNRSKDHLDYLEAIDPTVVGRDAVIFNIVDGGVGNWAVDEVLSSKVDVVYSELWSNETYGGVSDFIRYAKRNTGDKPVVLAAYMNRYEDTGGVFDTDSVLLADAAFFASGAFHLELGDGEHMLAQEYFPARDKVMSDDLKAKMADYYNFITAYERLLFAGDLRLGDGGLQWISLEGINLSGNATADTVWFLNRGTDAFEVFHLVNLLGNDNQWRNVANAPMVLQDIPVKLRLGPDGNVTGVFIASPDTNGGIMSPVDYSTGVDLQGKFLALTVDRLEYWDMIYVQRSMDTPAGGKYEAEDAIKWNVGVNTNHGGYSGSGFVDQYAETNDSVSFYVAIPTAGDYTFGFRYSNGASDATRSLIINGEFESNINFNGLGSWESWSTVTRTVHLAPGVHQVTLYYGSWNGGAINLDFLEIQQ